MNRTETPDLAAWVEQSEDATQRELREAVHTILTAIAHDPMLRTSMIIKGGILLATRYHSPRFTKDIDFSTAENLQHIPLEEIQHRLTSALSMAVELLDYGMDCRLQISRINPPNRPNATFPSMEFKIGYALKGTPKHARLLKLQSPSVISIDFSLNEIITATETLAIGVGASITAYTFADLVAEKFRSLLQQVTRNRYRRQDVYDLAMLSMLDISAPEKFQILQSLRAKSSARDITVNADSLNDPEVKRRAEAEYHTLKDEIAGPLPEFGEAWNAVQAFYGALPW